MTTRTEPREALSIEIEPELGDRIKAAAAARHVSAHDYVEGAITHALESEAPADAIVPRRLKEEERQKALVTIAEIDKLRHELFVQNGEKLFSPSWELINEMRDERTRELMRAVEE